MSSRLTGLTEVYSLFGSLPDMRLGTRHAVDVTLPNMRAEPDGRQWAAILRMAKLNGALMWYRQDNFVVGSPGSPVVDGDNQVGMKLNLRGFSANYHIRLGQAFSLIINGRRYLYFAGADINASSTGTVALPIFPMIRVSPGNGATAEFGKPYIQGSLSGNEVSWTRNLGGYFDFGTVSITEDE